MSREGMSNAQQEMSNVQVTQPSPLPAAGTETTGGPPPSTLHPPPSFRWFTGPVLLALTAEAATAYRLPYGDEILAFNGLRQEPLNSVFRFATHLGEAYAYVVAGVALILLRKYRYAALVALTGLLILPLSFLLKDQFGIMRPLTWFSQAERWQEVVTVPGVTLASGYTSFPSGHTISAFALYTLLTLMLDWKHRHWGLAFALLAVSVGVSRIFLVQHYLADVLGGTVMGLSVGWLVWRLKSLKFEV